MATIVRPAEIEPDAALMLRVKQGEGGALAELVEKYKQPVMNVVYRMLRDATEAEDLAQNVFVQVYNSATATKYPRNFSPGSSPSRPTCAPMKSAADRVIRPIQWMCPTQTRTASPGNSSRTGKPFRRLTACYRASWGRKSRRRWPSCPRTSALPSCFAVRTN